MAESGRTKVLGLLELDESAGEVLGMQEEDRLVMGAELRLAGKMFRMRSRAKGRARPGGRALRGYSITRREWVGIALVMLK